MDDTVRRHAEQIPERFELGGRLGEGGFGVVYRARDDERGAEVALKVLHDFDPENLYRFKREFRALTGIADPNLVTLYELFSSGDVWFFTMELVEGQNLVADLTDGEVHAVRAPSDSAARSRRAEIAPPEDAATAVESPVAATQTEQRDVRTDGRSDGDDHVGLPARRDEVPTLHPDRIRRRLRDLAGALDTLHGAGKLHRDLKPSNVLVEDDRVVVLDFGMVADLFEARDAEALDGSGEVFVGTPRYAAPEQAAGAGASPASDWYSVGVMIYEALTGFVPLDGDSSRDILAAKPSFRPVDVREFRQDIPGDLARLVMDLLAERPADRPDAAEVARRLGGSAVRSGGSSLRGESKTAPFVGREEERSECREAIRRATSGSPSQLVRILGDSGIGKTALVEEVLDEHESTANGPPVLRGRCYENESVPYKALDEWVDELARRHREDTRALPDGLTRNERSALSRVFPVLASLTADDTANQASNDASNRNDTSRETERTTDRFLSRTEHRDAAVRGLGRLLDSVAADGRIVVFIDDVQWGDRDSGELLARVLAADVAPVCTLFVTCRSDDLETSEFLTAFDDEAQRTDLAVDVADIELAPLDVRQGRQLAERLMGVDEADAVDTDVDRVVDETGGSPYFIGELARYVRRHDAAPGEVDRLDDVLTTRMNQLDPPARQLLEIVAVANRPIEREVAREVADLGERGPEAVATLRARRMLRVRGTESGDQLETYHDRLRETLRAAVDASRRRAIHGALAERLERRDVDPERLSDHYEHADHPELAAGFAVEAAEEAIEALAYDRAARMLRRAERLGTWEERELSALTWHRGQILERLGRCREAAEAFLEASRHRDGIPALRAQIRSAEQLMSAGRPREALHRLYEVVDKLDLDLPRRKQASSLPRLAWKRWSVTLGELDYRVRKPDTVPNRRRVRLRALSIIGGILATMDMKGSAYYQMEYLERAVDAGDPTHVASALTMHALREGSVETDEDWPLELLDDAEALIDVADQPNRIRLVAGLVRGVLLYSRGDWDASDAAFREVLDDYDPRDSGAMWEFQTLRFYSLMPLFWLGDFERYRRIIPDLLEEATDRENRLLETAARSWGYLARLTKDRPARALDGLDRAADRWIEEGYQLPDFWQMLGRGETALYTDGVSEAWPLLREHWVPLHTSLLMQIEIIYVLMHHLRARLALMAAHRASSWLRRRAWASLARRSAGCLETTGKPYAKGMAGMIEGELNVLAGDTDAALEAYREAETVLDRTDTAFYAAAARRRLGALIGGADGRDLVDEADEWMVSRGLEAPEKMAAMATARPTDG